MINVAKILALTETEGPGKRLCIWVQGCHLKCEGCCNKNLQPFIKKELITISNICEQILYSKKHYQIEGVTFLGGEPLLQAKGLSKIAKFCQENELSVICFTGFVYDTNSDIPFVEQLIPYIDVLIDGPYIQNLQCNKRNWVGSSNQRFIYFSDRYNSSIETMLTPKIELHVSKKGIVLNGDPNSIGRG